MKSSLKSSALTLSFSLFSAMLLAQNVGIGEANPASKLSVKGNLSVGYPTTAAPSEGAIIKGQTVIGNTIPFFSTDKLSVFTYDGAYATNSFIYNGIPSTPGGVSTAALYGFATGAGGVGLLVEHESDKDFGAIINTTTNNGIAALKGDSENSNAHGVLGEVSNGSIGYAVYANGNMYYAGGLYNPSDARLKENISTYASGLATIMALSPKTYEFKADLANKYNFASGKQIGFLAQDLKEVMPELVRQSNIVSTSKSSRSGKGDVLPETMTIEAVNYTGLIPVMTSAIQEQQSEIEALKKENQEMKAQLEFLMQEVQALKQAK